MDTRNVSDPKHIAKPGSRVHRRDTDIVDPRVLRVVDPNLRNSLGLSETHGATSCSLWGAHLGDASSCGQSEHIVERACEAELDSLQEAV